MEILIIAQIFQIKKMLNPNDVCKVIVSNSVPIFFLNDYFKKYQIYYLDIIIPSTMIFKKEKLVIILIIYPIAHESDDIIIEKISKITEYLENSINIVFYRNINHIILNEELSQNNDSIKLNELINIKWLISSSFMEITNIYLEFLNENLFYINELKKYLNDNKLSDKFVLNFDVNSTESITGSATFLYTKENENRHFFTYDILTKKNESVKYLSEKPFPLLFWEFLRKENVLQLEEYNTYFDSFFQHFVTNKMTLILYKGIMQGQDLQSEINLTNLYLYKLKFDYSIMQNSDESQIIINFYQIIFSQIQIDKNKLETYCSKNNKILMHSNIKCFTPYLIILILILPPIEFFNQNSLPSIFEQYFLKDIQELNFQPSTDKIGPENLQSISDNSSVKNENERSTELDLHSSIYKNGNSILEDDLSADIKVNEIKPNLFSILNIEDVISMISNKKYKTFDFESNLRKIKSNFIFNFRENGMNLLHLIVLNNRMEFLLPVMRCGFWNELSKQNILKTETNEHSGKTLEQLCITLKNNKILKEIKAISNWEKSMNRYLCDARQGELDRDYFLRVSDSIKNETDLMGSNALYWAIVSGNEELVNYLVDNNVNYDIINRKLENLLHISCTMGHFKLYDLLIGLKLDPLLKDNTKKSALSKVSENGDVFSLNELINLKIDKNLFAPTMALAGYYGQLDFLKILIDIHHLNINSKDDTGKTALLRAIEQNQLPTIQYLMSQNINFEDHDVRKRNIIHVAVESCTGDIFDYILFKLNNFLSQEKFKVLINKKDKYIGGELCMLIRGKDRGRSSWHYVEVHRNFM